MAEARPQGLVLLVNAQWQGGQAISDFGVGPWRRRTEAFLGSFVETYSLRQFRIFGDNVRRRPSCMRLLLARTLPASPVIACCAAQAACWCPQLRSLTISPAVDQSGASACAC